MLTFTGSCMKLQVAQLLNDMLWTARNAYITGDEDIMAHIAKGIYALYQVRSSTTHPFAWDTVS